MKLGQKVARVEKLGAKAIHTGTKLGAKIVKPAAAIAAVANPELAVPIVAGAEIAKPILKTIERASRR